MGPRFAAIRVERCGVSYVRVVHDDRPATSTKALIKSFGRASAQANEDARLFVHDAWLLGRLVRHPISKAARKRWRGQFEHRLNDRALKIILDDSAKAAEPPSETEA